MTRYHGLDGISNMLLARFTRTPGKRRTIWILAILWLVLQPVFDTIYYSTNLWRGVYPWNADAIAIPIFFHAMELAFVSPVILYVVWVGVREYPGNVSFLAFNKRRIFWSGFCTCVAFWFVQAQVNIFVWSVFTRQWGDTINTIFTAYFVICLRSALMTSTRFFGRPAPAMDDGGTFLQGV